jgi:hypothetical protein
MLQRSQFKIEIIDYWRRNIGLSYDLAKQKIENRIKETETNAKAAYLKKTNDADVQLSLITDEQFLKNVLIKEHEDGKFYKQAKYQIKYLQDAKDRGISYY